MKVGGRPVRLAGYDHLLRAGRRLQWDEAALDLHGDATAWPRVAPPRRSAIARLVAGFCVAEVAVAEHLAPFGPAAEDPVARQCFAVQAGDEARHARFFARVAREVCAIDEPRSLAGNEVLRLFEDELPATAAALAAGDRTLAEAVGLYHLVLEGIVFAAGQTALLEALDTAGTLPATRDGVARVQGDERWHVGLGVRVLQDADALDAAALDELGDRAARAAHVWGSTDAARQLELHRRRLTIALGAGA